MTLLAHLTENEGISLLAVLMLGMASGGVLTWFGGLRLLRRR
jgi:hypothetical protein